MSALQTPPRSGADDSGSAPPLRSLAARNPALWLLIALIAAGTAIRLVAAHQALFADELATYWDITATSVPTFGLHSVHGIAGVVALVHTDAEITPPLYFVLAWIAIQFGHAPELVRAPSLLAGIATIPLIYQVGRLTAGRRAGLVAAGLTAFSPFMVYYSAEARAYAVMMMLTLLSTLALLLAVEQRRSRWWILYAASSAAAMYSHYTCVFALGAQFLWLCWAHPEARRPALLANLGAVAAFVPWTTGFINDLNSPTTKIYSILSPFTVHDVRLSLEHWAVGYPYTWAARLSALPGVAALVMLGLGALAVLAGLVRGGLLRPRSWLAQADRRLLLLLGLALSVPVGEALVSAVSTHLFGVRNLAASWPGLALCLAVALVAAGPRLGTIAAALVVAAFAVGSIRTLDVQYARPDYRAAADVIDREAGPRDVVIDETGALSPGPLTGLDLALHRPHRVFRAASPAERDHPFNFFDRTLSLADTLPPALAAAGGARIFLVAPRFSRKIIVLARRTGQQTTPFPSSYRELSRRDYPGIIGTEVVVYARRGSA
ncbi:MAG: hypothetical protein NVSMB51_20790 [Solirubrobacteraceae bacterium]